MRGSALVNECRHTIVTSTREGTSGRDSGLAKAARDELCGVQEGSDISGCLGVDRRDAVLVREQPRDAPGVGVTGLHA